MTLTDLCGYLKNWFELGGRSGVFTISDGTIDLDYLREGQYFRITGSIFNDGVYQYPPSDLKDETFDGTIWALAIPPAVLELRDKIDAWENDNAKALTSPYQSESFGGYSYTMKGGDSFSWREAFAADLRRWRKI